MWLKVMSASSFLALLLGLTTSLQAEVKKLYFSDPISAYQDKDKAANTCFVSIKTTPQKKIKKRQDSQLMLSHMIDSKNAGNSFRNQISWVSGVKLNAGTPVTLKIGEQEFKLKVQDDRAWTEDSKADQVLLQALLNAKDIKIQAKTHDNQEIVDTIKNLKSLQKAIEAINKACPTKLLEKQEKSNKK